MTNVFLNLFGVKTRKKEFKVVSTDYTSYAVFYTCNDDNWLKSYDQYSINIRKVADASTTLNNLITFAANNIFFTNNTAAVADLIGTYTKYDQTNPICKQITD